MHSLPSPQQQPHIPYYVETPPSPKSRKPGNFPKYMPPLDSSYRLYKPLFKREGDDPFKYESPTPAQSPYDTGKVVYDTKPYDTDRKLSYDTKSPYDKSPYDAERKVSAPVYDTERKVSYDGKPTSMPWDERKNSAPVPATYNYTTEPRKRYSVPSKVYMPQYSSSRATIKKARRAYRSKFTQEQDRLIISMKNENKTWQEIKEMVKGETPHNIQRRYEVLMAQMNGNLIWEQDDLDALVDLLEAAERHKWKHISSELSRKLDKKVTPLACQKKFKEMFGVAENSSLLGSSLCYAYYDNGWACVE
ncbi:hypothetical protein CJU89_0891 [Yarrowia sp. B02]|nr:hypothetical protein CJU89_0891 [Yarrowia sp. B02]